MERSKTTLNERNGHTSAVLDKELILDLETLEARTIEKSAKRKKPIALILAALGIGAIARQQLEVGIN